SYTIGSLTIGEYRTEAGGGGQVIPPGTVIDTTQVLHFYYASEIAPFCVIDTDVTVTILSAANVTALPNVFDCVSYTLPELASGNYFTQPNGQGTQLSAGDVISSTQTIYIYATGGTASHPCNDQKQFTVTIGMAMPPDVAQCQPYTLPVLASGNYYTGPNATGDLIPGGTVISQSQTIYIHIPNSTACVGDLHFNISIAQPQIDTLLDVSVCDAYVLPVLTNGQYYTGPIKTGDQLQPGDAILSTQTIYIYAEVADECYNQSSFNVTINPLPDIDSRSDIDICNSYTLTPLAAGHYYTGPDGTGTQLPDGSVITTSQTI